MHRRARPAPGGSQGGRTPDEERSASAKKIPNDRETDPDFTRQFNSYVANYYSPTARFVRWYRRMVDSIGAAVSEPLDSCPVRRTPVLISSPEAMKFLSLAAAGELPVMGRPEAHERLLAAVSYILPLAGGLAAAQPLTVTWPMLPVLLWPFYVLASPMSTPLGATMATASLLCGALDKKSSLTSYLRFNFTQALFLSGITGILGLIAKAAPTLSVAVAANTAAGLGAAEGLGAFLAQRAAMWSALGLSLGTFVVSAWCCLWGRYPDRIPGISWLAHQQISQ